VRAAFGDFWDSRRLVELERFVPSGRDVRRFDCGLLDIFLPRPRRMAALRDCRRCDCGDWLHQRARIQMVARWRRSWRSLFSCQSWRCARSRQRGGTTIRFRRCCRRTFRRFKFSAWAGAGLVALLGYEQVSSVAEEVENPRRSYPIALAVVIPLSIATYFLPTMFSLAALATGRSGTPDIFPMPRG